MSFWEAIEQTINKIPDGTPLFRIGTLPIYKKELLTVWGIIAGVVTVILVIKLAELFKDGILIFARRISVALSTPKSVTGTDSNERTTSTFDENINQEKQELIPETQNIDSQDLNKLQNTEGAVTTDQNSEEWQSKKQYTYAELVRGQSSVTGSINEDYPYQTLKPQAKIQNTVQS